VASSALVRIEPKIKRRVGRPQGRKDSDKRRPRGGALFAHREDLEAEAPPLLDKDWDDDR
jgi:hypothetical protein